MSLVLHASGNLDEFRSSSDVSEAENQLPSITGAVLRSSKKLVCSRSPKCPGTPLLCSPVHWGVRTRTVSCRIITLWVLTISHFGQFTFTKKDPASSTLSSAFWRGSKCLEVYILFLQSDSLPLNFIVTLSVYIGLLQQKPSDETEYR